MEYRLWITIPDLPLGDEDRWEPLALCLEQEFAEFGPVFTWAENVRDLIAIIALNADNESEAARLGVGVIADALQRVGLSDRYPMALEVQDAEAADTELAPA